MLVVLRSQRNHRRDTLCAMRKTSERRAQKNKHQSKSIIENIIKAAIAIITWICCYLFVTWIRGGGFWTYYLYVAPSVLIVFLILSSSRIGRKIVEAIGSAFIWAIDNLEDNSDWIAFAIVVACQALFIGMVIFFHLDNGKTLTTLSYRLSTVLSQGAGV
ncbi:MAG: hypothetical protein ACREBD_30475 [Blastocatellia bacterium]